jgi:acyl carrier protein
VDGTMLDRVRQVLAFELAPPLGIEDIRPTMKLGHDLHADSLDNIELLMAIEEEFQIEIPDADWEGLFGADGQSVSNDPTVQELADLVEKHRERTA